MTVNVGVIGVGMIGQEHIRRLMTTVPGANVVAVSDVEEARAREAAELVSGAKVYAEGEDLILAREVEAVIVASWGPTHAAYRACGDQGRQAGPVREAARNDGSGLLGDPRRRDRLRPPAGAGRDSCAGSTRNIVAMKETIASGAIGAPLIFQSGHRNASVPAHYTGEMSLTDTAVHDIDIARFLLDDEPASITVRAPRRNSRAGDVADPLMTLIDMRSGALVAIETSVNVAYGYDIRGEVIGESGAVSLPDRSEVVVKTNGAFMGRIPPDWRERFAPAFDAEFRAFIAAASEGRVAGPSAWDGYVATVTTLAGVKALKSKKTEPVKLRRRPKLYAS